MATARTYYTAAVPPLVMAVLLFLPKFMFALSAPLLASAVIFLVIFCFVFFWGCVWLSVAIGRLLTITRPWALLVVNVMVQFLLTASASIPGQSRYAQLHLVAGVQRRLRTSGCVSRRLSHLPRIKASTAFCAATAGA